MLKCVLNIFVKNIGKHFTVSWDANLTNLIKSMMLPFWCKYVYHEKNGNLLTDNLLHRKAFWVSLPDLKICTILLNLHTFQLKEFCREMGAEIYPFDESIM
jgi:hypothetical protein